MKLSKQNLRALAREARKLASEVCEGSAPEFTCSSYYGCAVGTMIWRVFGWRVPNGITGDVDYERYLTAVAVDEYLPDTYRRLGIVSRELQDHGPGALPFPLLALADELENAAQRPPESP